MKPLTFRIPQIPPSFNKHFRIIYSQKRVEYSREAREFMNLVKRFMPPWEVSEGDLYKVSMRVVTDWYYKNKKLRKLDVQNMDKLLIDAMFSKIGQDDSRIWESHIYKVQSEKDNYTDITVEVINYE